MVLKHLRMSPVAYIVQIVLGKSEIAFSVTPNLLTLFLFTLNNGSFQNHRLYLRKTKYSVFTQLFSTPRENTVVSLNIISIFQLPKY